MTTLFAIGGAINMKNPSVLREFIRRSGGPHARIVVLPQASSLAETGEFYLNKFLELGAETCVALEFRHRSDAGTPQQVALLRNASGIFIAGGNQMRLPGLFGGTALQDELTAAYRRGCVVGGTSAGAAVLSRVMIASGKGGPTPREQIVQLGAGFGFSDRYLFDMHFRQRDRLGRLIYAVASNPGVLGVGVDEDTAAIVQDDVSVTVCGSGAVTLVDGSRISATDLPEIEKKGPVAVSDLNVHVLTNGCTYDWKTRKVFIPEKIFLVE